MAAARRSRSRAPTAGSRSARAERPGQLARRRLSRASRPRPGAEVLRGEVLAGDLAQILVHIGRFDRLTLPVVVDELEQLLPRQVAACLDDPGQTAIVEIDLMLDAALAAERELHLAARH